MEVDHDGNTRARQCRVSRRVVRDEPDHRNLAARALLVFPMHAGSMISGSLELFDGVVARYVSASEVPMLSVDYRLAPEHPHPTPIEDAHTGLRWLHDHAAVRTASP